MNEWKIVKVYHDSQSSYTCQHCGRAIRNIAIIKNNITGEEMRVGLTCLDKIMNLNETFAKALQSHIKSYYKKVAEYNKLMNKSDEELYFETLNSLTTLEYTTRYEIAHQIVKDKWIATAQIARATEELNKFSKSGLINLENLEELKQLTDELRIKMDFVKDTKWLPNGTEKALAENERLEKMSKKEEEKRQQEEAEKQIYIGLETEKVDLKEVELIEIEEESGYYGTTYFYTFKKDNYNLVWKTTKDLQLEVNTVINIKGTIKENRECQEGNFSYLTRCKIA